MIGLDNIMKLPGFIAAGQFDENGNPIRTVGNLTEKMSLMAAKMSAYNNTHFSQQIAEFMERTGKGCKQLNGWGFWCDKVAICAIGRTLVVVETSKVNFNQLMTDLLDEKPTGPKPMNN